MTVDADLSRISSVGGGWSAKKAIACLSRITAARDEKFEYNDALSASCYLLSFALVSDVAVIFARQFGIEPVSPSHSRTSLMRRLPT